MVNYLDIGIDWHVSIFERQLKMKFNCTKCKLDVYIADSDRDFFMKELKGQCLNCYTVLIDEPHIPGTVTLFSNMGGGFGDQVFASVVKKFYILTHPDETIIFLNETMDPPTAKEKYNYHRYFWANIQFNNFPTYVQAPKGVTWFNMINEAHEINRQFDVFPELPARSQIVEDLPEHYIVLHARNINQSNRHDTFKNVTADELKIIFDALDGFPCVMIGNDDLIKYNYPPNVKHYLSNLSIDQIKYVIEWSSGFIGKDSGLIHFASTLNIPFVFGWGFKDVNWMPISRGNCSFFSADKLNDNTMANIIKGMISR